MVHIFRLSGRRRAHSVEYMSVSIVDLTLNQIRNSQRMSEVQAKQYSMCTRGNFTWCEVHGIPLYPWSYINKLQVYVPLRRPPSGVPYSADVFFFFSEDIFCRFGNIVIRPFLMQSDSASRKRPFSTGFFWSSFFLSSVESIL